jgi:nucleotide-binding universal stress UspA family protein
MYRWVLVPLDGSRFAEGVLPLILQVGGPCALEVVLVRVVKPTLAPRLESADTDYCVVDVVAAQLKDAEEYLAAVAANLREHGVRVASEARHGEPVAELVAAARETRAGLIAMTTHGRGGSGSVTEALLRQAEIPVLMMRLPEPQVPAAEAA